MIPLIRKLPKGRNRVVDRNRKELDRQIAEYQPKLKSFIRSRVADRDDADDILQEVLFQWVKTADAAMNPIENLSAWLYRVARNMIVNFGAKRKEERIPAYRNDEHESGIIQEFSEILFGKEAAAPSPETEYLRSLVWEELENALAELPPEQRTVFELTELDGIPVKEIAAATSVSVATLLSRKHYAVLHLRKRLAGLYNEIIYC